MSIEKQADQLLEQFGITRAPVPVEKLAVKMDIEVTPTDLGPGISGVLLIKNDHATIGVNESESRQRRRFTVAHELGHYILHKGQSEFFIDKNLGPGLQILFRDGESSSGEKRKEKEANAFAAALLMPKSILQREINEAIESNEIHSEEELIKVLAKKFDVSQIALTYRISNLINNLGFQINLPPA